MGSMDICKYDQFLTALGKYVYPLVQKQYIKYNITTRSVLFPGSPHSRSGDNESAESLIQ